MEKIFGEDEMKGLEEEIDSAVDRLFVEKKKTVAESLSVEPQISQPSHEAVKEVDREISFRPSAEAVPSFKPLEKIETQLLSLEWEITGENLEKTKEEVLALRETLKERADVTSVLNLMGKVLIHMMRNEENIQPSQIKFLMDSKETIKLLMRKETSSEFSTYKQLAFGGIEAKYMCLEGLKEAKTKQTPIGANETDKTEGFKRWEKQMEGMLHKMDFFSEKMDVILKAFERHLSSLDQVKRIPSEAVVEKKSLLVDVTIFKIDKKLFGIESQKIFKLFKVPNTFRERYSDQQKIRLKDLEIKMVDLRKIFPMETKGQREEMQLITVKEDGEYKGLIVDQMIKKLSTEAEISEEHAEYFMGTVHWIYQEQPVEIPLLDLKKI